MRQPLNEQTARTLDVIAAIFLRCFIITVVSLLFVWGAVAIAGDQFYRIHSFVFDLTRPQFDLFVLVALTFIKSLNVVFFLFPWIAIRLCLRSAGIAQASDSTCPP